jgi:hypothetical protein
VYKYTVFIVMKKTNVFLLTSLQGYNT